MDERRPNRASDASLALAAAAGAGAVWWTTRFGTRVFPDSAVYVSAARNLLRGSGFATSTANMEGFALFTGTELQPVTHFPPLYSLLLAALSPFGGDPLKVARPLGAALFGAIVFLTGLSVRR
ncbi:MAG: hypothetical protein HY925_15965, partial [Elusimicrobia bacterium]|nr:hypothetical protein [Elusimicrobiota bacterium]